MVRSSPNRSESVTLNRPPRPEDTSTCGGAAILDLALCLILAVTVVGLLLLAL
jgi:hypothetical protein